MKKLTKVQFIKKSKTTHGDRYDYSLVVYINNSTKVKIICNEHGVFEQVPNNHINGQGCPKCGKILSNNSKKKCEKTLINDFIKKHNNKYDYSLVEYINCNIKVKIICRLHGIFDQLPLSHLKGINCPSCTNNRKMNNETFAKKANEIHNNEYDYSLVNYVNSLTKVEIICKKHGVFIKSPNNHISKKQGCPICSESFGENSIRLILEKHDIKYEKQKRFKKCKHHRQLPFDFYLPDYNLCIEYDGEQHYDVSHYFNKKSKINNIKQRDQIKTDYCKDSGIGLIRIKYNEDIEEKLNNYFNI